MVQRIVKQCDCDSDRIHRTQTVTQLAIVDTQGVEQEVVEEYNLRSNEDYHCAWCLVECLILE